MFKKLSELNRGETFEIGGYKFIVLSKKGDSVECLLRTYNQFTSSARFSDTNCDFGKSSLCKILNTTFIERLTSGSEPTIREEDIIDHIVDLTTLDGQKRYGFTIAKISLLTFDGYRKHKDIIPKERGNWWLATPWSDADNYSRSVCIVYSNGALDYSVCGDNCGVRPFCILKSSILVSVDE